MCDAGFGLGRRGERSGVRRGLQVGLKRRGEMRSDRIDPEVPGTTTQWRLLSFNAQFSRFCRGRQSSVRRISR